MTGRPLPEKPSHNAQSEVPKVEKAAQALAEDVLVTAGFAITGRNSRLRGLGVTVSFIAADAEGYPWYFDVSGAFTITRSGLASTGTLLRTLGRANVMVNNAKTPLVLLTSSFPKAGSDGDLALRAVGPKVIFDAIELQADEQIARLKIYAEGGRRARPEGGFWLDNDLANLDISAAKTGQRAVWWSHLRALRRRRAAFRLTAQQRPWPGQVRPERQ